MKMTLPTKDCAITIVTLLVVFTSLVTSSRHADSYGVRRRAYFQKVYREVFEELHPKKEGDPAPITKFVLVYVDQLKSMVQSPTAEEDLDAYQLANVKFWIDAARLQVTKCDVKYDDKMMERYRQHAVRVLPPDKIEKLQDYDWRFRDLVDEIRKQQLKYCVNRLEKLIDGTAWESIKFMSDLIVEPHLTLPKEDGVKIIRSCEPPKSSSKNKVLGCFGKSGSLKETDYKTIYTEKIINPCQRIVGSRELVNTLADYVERLHGSPDSPRGYAKVRSWRKYAEWCTYFVRGDKQKAWAETYSLLKNEL